VLGRVDNRFRDAQLREGYRKTVRTLFLVCRYKRIGCVTRTTRELDRRLDQLGCPSISALCSFGLHYVAMPCRTIDLGFVHTQRRTQLGRMPGLGHGGSSSEDFMSSAGERNVERKASTALRVQRGSPCSAVVESGCSERRVPMCAERPLQEPSKLHRTKHCSSGGATCTCRGTEQHRSSSGRKRGVVRGYRYGERHRQHAVPLFGAFPR
jgi:hypothetical protein